MSKIEKSPYKDFTIEQVAKAEKGAYVIQYGGEFFEYNGRYTFNKATAEKFYEQLYEGCKDLLKSSDREERLDGIKVIFLLKIHPFRLQ